MRTLTSPPRHRVTAWGERGRPASAGPPREHEGGVMALVGLDVGTSGVKGVALDAHGQVTARATATYPLATPQPGWAEQDPETWWTATQAVLAALGDAVDTVDAIALSGQ